MTARAMRGYVTIATTITAVVVLLAVGRIWFMHEIGYYWTADIGKAIKIRQGLLATDVRLLVISALAFVVSFLGRRRMLVLNLLLSALCVACLLYFFCNDYFFVSRIQP